MPCSRRDSKVGQDVYVRTGYATCDIISKALIYIHTLHIRLRNSQARIAFIPKSSEMENYTYTSAYVDRMVYPVLSNMAALV